jgi:hypothetical protein
MLTATTSTRSNRSIFVPRDTGSPNDGLLKHILNLDSKAVPFKTSFSVWLVFRAAGI